MRDGGCADGEHPYRDSLRLPVPRRLVPVRRRPHHRDELHDGESIDHLRTPAAHLDFGQAHRQAEAANLRIQGVSILIYGEAGWILNERLIKRLRGWSVGHLT